MTIFLSNCQTTGSSFKNKNNPYRIDLENCLDKFFAPRVPIGKIQKYDKWMFDNNDSIEASRVCSTEIDAFLINTDYKIDKTTIQVQNWTIAMSIYKHTFKPNQNKGVKRTFNPHPDAIGNWWAIPVGVLKQ